MSSINLQYFSNLADDLTDSGYVETAKDMRTLVAEITELQSMVATVIEEGITTEQEYIDALTVAENEAYDAGVLDIAATSFEERQHEYNAGHQYGYSQGYAAALRDFRDSTA